MVPPSAAAAHNGPAVFVAAVEVGAVAGGRERGRATDVGFVGGLVGATIGIAGGLVGTWASVRNTGAGGSAR